MRKHKPKFMVRASAVNAINRRKGSVVAVLASETLEVPGEGEQSVMASYNCNGCSTQFASLSGMKPYCVTCGSDEVTECNNSEETNDLPPEQLNSDEPALSAVLCSSCHTNNIMSDVVAASLGGSMHCITCGEHLSYDVPQTQEDETATDDDEMEEVDVLDVSEDDDQQDSTTDAGTEDTKEESVILDDSDLHPPVDVGSSDTLPVGETKGEAGANNTTLDDDMEYDLNDMVAEGESDVMVTDDKLVAMINGIPVATVEKAGLNPEYAGIWGKQSLIRAVTEAMNQDVKSALAHFNFTSIRVKVPVKASVDALVAKEVAQLKADLSAELAGLKEDYKQSLAIAMAGLNKGFFKDVSNPLKASFFTALDTRGVTNAAKVVDQVFATAGGSFLEAILSQADELLAKPVVVRNELAQVVESSTYISASEDDDLDDDDIEDTGEQLATHAGLRIESKEQAVATVRKFTSMFPK